MSGRRYFRVFSEHNFHGGHIWLKSFFHWKHYLYRIYFNKIKISVTPFFFFQLLLFNLWVVVPWKAHSLNFKHCSCFSFVINILVPLKKHCVMASVALGTETVKSYLEGTVSTDRHGMKRNPIKLHSFHFMSTLLLATRKIIQKHSNKLSAQIKLNSRKLICHVILSLFQTTQYLLLHFLWISSYIYFIWTPWCELSAQRLAKRCTSCCVSIPFGFIILWHTHKKCLLSATWTKTFLPNLFTASEILFDSFCQRSKWYLQRSCTSILPKAYHASLWNPGSAGPHPG